MEVRRCTQRDASAMGADGPAAGSYAAGAFDRQHRGVADFLVVLVDSKVAGSAELTFDEPPELKNLGVAAAFRGRGLGSALIAHAEKLVEERHPGAAKGERALLIGVGLENPRAAALYEKLGFVRTGRVSTTTYEYIDDDGASHTATEHDEDLIKRW